MWCAQKSDEHDEPQVDELYRTGTIVEVQQVRRQPDASLQVEVEAICRVNLNNISQEDPCLMGELEEVRETSAGGREIDALMRHLVELFTSTPA